MLPMKADLQELIISNGEFRKHIGEEYDVGFWFFLFIITGIIAIIFGILAVYFRLSFSYYLCGILGSISFLLGDLFVKPLLMKWRFRTAYDIKKQVDNHNQIIENLHTLDQLSEIGNPVKINDRDAVIEALRITREGLVRALQTDRILRENPKFKPEYFNIDLSTLEAEKTTVKAIEYAQLLDDAVQIGVSVQKEMRKLQSKR